MYQVFGSRTTRALRVLWLLEELGLAYDHIDCRPRDPAVLALSPSGKVPVLVVEGVVLTDSVAIMTFLADRHAALTYPAGTLERGRQDGLTQAICDELDALLWTAARHSFVLPEDRRLPAIKDSLRWEWARNLDRMSDRLGDGPFLMGDKLTIADLLCAHCLHWGKAARFDIGPERLRAYLGRMQARDSWQRLSAR